MVDLHLGRLSLEEAHADLKSRSGEMCVENSGILGIQSIVYKRYLESIGARSPWLCGLFTGNRVRGAGGWPCWSLQSAGLERRHCLLMSNSGGVMYYYCPKFICIHKTMVPILDLICMYVLPYFSLGKPSAPITVSLQREFIPRRTFSAHYAVDLAPWSLSALDTFK